MGDGKKQEQLKNGKKFNGSKVKTDRSLFILWFKWLERGREGEESGKQG